MLLERDFFPSIYRSQGSRFFRVFPGLYGLLDQILKFTDASETSLEDQLLGESSPHQLRRDRNGVILSATVPLGIPSDIGGTRGDRFAGIPGFIVPRRFNIGGTFAVKRTDRSRHADESSSRTGFIIAGDDRFCDTRGTRRTVLQTSGGIRNEERLLGESAIIRAAVPPTMRQMRLIRVTAAMVIRASGDRRVPALNRHPVVVGHVVRATMVVQAADRVPAGGQRRQEALAGRHRVSGVLPLCAMANG